jgi:hypothetical protein
MQFLFGTPVYETENHATILNLYLTFGLMVNNVLL